MVALGPTSLARPSLGRRAHPRDARATFLPPAPAVRRLTVMRGPAGMLVATLLLAAGCGGDDDAEEPATDVAESITVSSSAFEADQPIPRHYTCDGHDISPPLAWGGVPADAEAVALVVDDPDAPGGTFTHWLAWDLEPAAGKLGEGQAAPSEGSNDFGRVGYRGPCPPPGRGPHRYILRLYALDASLDVRPGADKADIERALNGRSLATAELVGRYER
jgi:Raf kinase inhibitor-like YbhB/YbcL family protein